MIKCEKCGTKATTISVRGDDIREHAKHRLAEQAKRAEGLRVISGDELLALMDAPHPAHWWITCDHHYPGADGTAYWLTIERDGRGLVEMLRHIGEKNWVMDDTRILELAFRLLSPEEAAKPRSPLRG